MSTDRHNDETIRRLRAESTRRLAREARWRAFAAWCAVVTLAGGFSLAGLEAHDRGQREAKVPEPEIEPVAADADRARSDELARAKAERERLAKREAGSMRTRPARRAAPQKKPAHEGCDLGRLKGRRRPPPGDLDDLLRDVGAL